VKPMAKAIKILMLWEYHDLSWGNYGFLAFNLNHSASSTATGCQFDTETLLLSGRGKELDLSLDFGSILFEGLSGVIMV